MCDQYKVDILTRGGTRDDIESLFNSVVSNGVFANEVSRLTGSSVDVAPGSTTQAVRAARENCAAETGGAKPPKSPTPSAGGQAGGAAKPSGKKKPRSPRWSNRPAAGLLG